MTICAHRRAHHFGEILNGEMALSAIGAVVEHEWLKTAVARPEVDPDVYVIMPNHLHGIIVIGENPFVGATRRVAPTTTTLPKRSLGSIIGQFKSSVTKRVRRYILDNPARWDEDDYFSPPDSPR